MRLVLLGVLLAAAGWVRVAIGPESSDPEIAAHLMEIRSFRTVSAALVGGCLGVAGVLLQGLLRNPLASPDIMGLASGAGLAVMLSAYGAAELGLNGEGGPVVPAMAGACMVLGLVFILSHRAGVIDPIAMILVGVIVSITCSAGTMLVQHLLPDRGVYSGRWLYGGIDEDAGLGRLVLAGVALGLGVWATAWFGRVLDASMMSEDEARSVGVRLGLVRVGQFLGAGVLSGAAVSLAGPIGFIGLIGPHMARALVGPRHVWQGTASALVGAGLVVGADAGVRALALPSGRLPLGVVTALLGGPMFLGMLIRMRRGGQGAAG
jgi:iron complex transport system permease protein